VPWVSPFRWETKQVAETQRKTRVVQRVCFRYELLAAFFDRLAAIDYFCGYRPAGTREALPGTICGTCVPHFPWRAHPKAALLEIRIDQRRNSNLANGRWSQKGRSMLRPYMETLAVGEHLLDAGHVGFIYERELFQLAHAAGPFCTHQVALAGVPALDLAVRRELEALPGAAVGLQLQFRFRSVSRHCWKSSPDLNALRVKARLEIRT
jgi:hypothetical protein